MKYGFYPGCSFHGAAGYEQSLTAVSRHLGITFEELPDWNCCGATVVMGQDDFQAAALSARIFALAVKAGFDEVVTGCNACYTALRKGGDLLRSSNTYLEEINRRLTPEGLSFDTPLPVRHLLQVFMDDLPADIWQRNRQTPLPGGVVAGYYGCQFTRPWKDGDNPEQPGTLERWITTLGFTPTDHSAKTLCCGASHCVPYGDDCLPLIDRIFRGVRAAGADVITTICPLCQFNLDNGQRRTSPPQPTPVLFFTQLAGIALGLPTSDLGLNRLLTPCRGVFDRK